MRIDLLSMAGQFMMSTCVVGTSLFAYDRMTVRPGQTVGVVDVGEVYRLKEAEFTQMITKGASEEQRQKALVLAHQFAQQLPIALEELPRDCHCLVIIRSSVAGSPPHSVDLTPLLKHKVDLP